MGLFSKKPKKTGVELLQEKSKNVVNVFTQTVDELRSINEDVRTSVDELATAKAQIEKDICELNTLQQSNEKVIFNIQKIME